MSDHGLGRKRRMVGILGLGPRDKPAPYYDEVVYAFGDRRAKKTPLVQAAIEELFGPFDEMVLLGTQKVQARWFGDDRLANRYLPATVRFIEVPAGSTERELRGLFETIGFKRFS